MASEAGTAHSVNPGSKADVCAVVVTFHPDTGFPDRLARVRSQVGRVVVVDNGSPPPVREMLRNAAAGTDVELILNDANLGVATALNQGVGHARDRSFRWALTLDQDSFVEPFLVEALLEAFNGYPAREKVAVVGSNYFDEERRRTLVPELPAQPPCLEQKTVITSGTLLSLAAFDRIGPFRDDFFIDHVDDEYCLRAWAMGYKVILCRRSVIRHPIGAARPFRLFGRKLWSSNHAAARRYYMARNFAVLGREYLRSEPGWVLHRFARHAGFFMLMTLFEDRRAEKTRCAWRGLRDALRGTMGKYPERAGGG